MAKVTQLDAQERHKASLEDLKCPVCGEVLYFEGRHVTGPWDGPPARTEVTVFLVCTCVSEEGFKLE